MNFNNGNVNNNNKGARWSSRKTRDHPGDCRGSGNRYPVVSRVSAHTVRRIPACSRSVAPASSAVAGTANTAGASFNATLSASASARSLLIAPANVSELRVPVWILARSEWNCAVPSLSVVLASIASINSAHSRRQPPATG